MGNGQPTKYKKEYCQMLIDHMSKGLSFEAFAGVVGVAKQTIYSWKEKFPEFKEARDIAFSKSRLYWEKEGVTGLYKVKEYDSKGNVVHDKQINATIWLFNMKNRFGWRDKQPGEDYESGKKQQTPDEISSRISELLKKRNAAE